MDKETSIYMTVCSKELVFERALNTGADGQPGMYFRLKDRLEARKEAALADDVWSVQQINAQIRTILGAYIIDDEK
jgi:hypothetical protein